MPDIGVSKDSLRQLVGLSGEFVGTTDAAVITTKTVVLEDNTVKQTTPSLGAILVDNGTKVVARTRPAANLPLHGNSGGTDIEYSKLEVAGGGTGATTLTGIVKASGTSAFTAVAAPTGAIVGDTDTQNISNKTFLDQGFKLRNPANTATLTFRNPVITTDGDTRIQQPYKYVVFLDGGVYYCKNQQTGRIESSSATADTVLQYSLDNALRASVYWANGSYNIVSTTTGLTISQTETNLTMDQGCIITVPQGFTGKLFTLGDGISVSHISGGRFTEGGTPARLWTCFYLEGNAGGVNTNYIGDCYIRFCAKAIELKSSGVNGWVNGNIFHNVFCDQHVIGAHFNQSVAQVSTNGIRWNTFDDCTFNGAAGVTTNGIKDICGQANLFIGVKCWDTPVGASTSNITSDASETMILGGIMTNVGFTDSGTRTYINEYWTGLKDTRTNAQMTFGWGLLGLRNAADTFSTVFRTNATTSRTLTFPDNTSEVLTATAVQIAIANKTFADQGIALRNPANTFSYTLVHGAIAAARNITLPVLAASDTFVFEAHTQALTNKTLDSTNTISSATSLPVVTVAKGGTGQATATLGFDALSPMTTAGDIIYGGASGTRTKLGIGTANQLLRTNSGATAPEWASTLTGLTLVADSNTISATTNVTGQVLRNNGTKFIASVPPHMPSSGRKHGYMVGGSNAGAMGIWHTAIATTTTPAGVLTTYADGTTTVRTTTAATTGTKAAWRVNYGFTFRGFNPRMKAKFKLSVATLNRIYLGFTTLTASDHTGEDPLNAISGVMLCTRSADTNFQIAHNDGTGVTVFDDTGIAADTGRHVIEIIADDTNTKFTWKLDASAVTDVSTDIPAQTTKLGSQFGIETNENVAHSIDLYYWEVETD